METLLRQHPQLAECRDQIERAAARLIECFAAGRRLLLCGNGGSAADCEHIAGELLKGFQRRRPLPADRWAALADSGAPDAAYIGGHLQGALPAVSLVNQVALGTAFANDVAADLVFAQLVGALGAEGDVLMAISTSGEARNCCLAAQTARAFGLFVLGLTGRTGGSLAPLCDLCIRVPADGTADCQQLHLPVYHYLCRTVEAHFFPE
jgi:D-sedoheptulose 7-phosphate isomerase